jgi:hypothetical protein
VRQCDRAQFITNSHGGGPCAAIHRTCLVNKGMIPDRRWTLSGFIEGSPRDHPRAERTAACYRPGMAKELLRGKELEKRAQELGISMIPGNDMSAGGTVLEPGLQRRVWKRSARCASTACGWWL